MKGGDVKMIKLIGEPLKQWDQHRMVEVITDKALLDISFYTETGKSVYKAKPSVNEEGKKVALIPNILLTKYGVITVIASELASDGDLLEERQTFEVRINDKSNDYRFIPDSYTIITYGCE